MLAQFRRWAGQGPWSRFTDEDVEPPNTLLMGTVSQSRCAELTWSWPCALPLRTFVFPWGLCHHWTGDTVVQRARGLSLLPSLPPAQPRRSHFSLGSLHSAETSLPPSGLQHEFLTSTSVSRPLPSLRVCTAVRMVFHNRSLHCICLPTAFQWLPDPPKDKRHSDSPGLESPLWVSFSLSLQPHFFLPPYCMRQTYQYRWGQDASLLWLYYLSHALHLSNFYSKTYAVNLFT